MTLTRPTLAGQYVDVDLNATTANSRLVFGIVAALAEVERELIVERARAAVQDGVRQAALPR